MKFTFVILWCIFWTSPANSTDNSFSKTRIEQINEDYDNDFGDDYYYDEWFIQKLDHFNPKDTRTWKQRYKVNFDYYQKGGPVFLSIGGENEISDDEIESGAWIHYAIDFGALCIHIEHRFYGKSRPTKDLRTANLRFLTVGQALADLEEFTIKIKPKYNIPSTTKWIVFGGSYAGSLAMWMRMNYPNIIHAAVSSSGGFIAKTEYHESFEVIEKALKTYSPECVLEIKKAVQSVTSYLKSVHGAYMVKKMFNLCTVPLLTNNQEIKYFYYSQAEMFAAAVQYDDFNRINKEGLYHIQSICDTMVNKSLGKPIDRLAVVNRVNNKLDDLYCVENNYFKDILRLRSPSWNLSKTGYRQWRYQLCTELGTFETSNLKTDLFGPNIPIDFFERMCADIFGQSFNFKNLETGMKNINKLNIRLEEHRILNVQGTNDPWYKLGVLKEYESYASAIIIEGASHCADMNFPMNTDEQIKEVYEIIHTVLSEWL